MVAGVFEVPTTLQVLTQTVVYGGSCYPIHQDNKRLFC